jgi:hypothetical protein
MSKTKHDRLIEKLTDSFWKQDTAVTNPARMVDVLECLIEILREQPRSVDDAGALAWTALWLERRLEQENRNV